ncbi:hypothetical protein [Marivita sp. S2033]|uniref:hypothetical protein n=1 Tax=Marivita sp. S2033 TaxID=3373187 RepID=UPI00398203B8
MGKTVWIIVAIVVVVLGIWMFTSDGDGVATTPDAPAAIETPATEAPEPAAPAAD